jgi:hypothetical protein
MSALFTEQRRKSRSEKFNADVRIADLTRSVAANVDQLNLADVLRVFHLFVSLHDLRITTTWSCKMARDGNTDIGGQLNEFAVKELPEFLNPRNGIPAIFKRPGSTLDTMSLNSSSVLFSRQ